MILVPEKIMTAGTIGQEPNLEKQIRKQMGCMTGFFQIFDRHQILTGKRLCSANTLHSGPLCDSTRETQESVGSPAMSSELEKSRSMPSPDPFKKSEIRPPAPEPVTPSQTSLPLPVFDFREGTRSSWKFSKESPRLSLDSRAVVDAKGSLKPREIHTNASILSPVTAANDEQRRSPSVIARLMGLEAMMKSEPEPEKKVELRRSASESRVSRDLFQNRFIDGVNLQVKQSSNPPMNSYNNVVAEEKLKHDPMMKNNSFDRRDYNARTARAQPAKVHQRRIGQRKCFYDSADFFPEPKQTVSVCNEIEKRLKQRGIDEPSKDLETLRHILEALQLKGLLHSNIQYSSPANNRNFVYERSYFHPSEESPIVVMKSGRRLSTDFAENCSSVPGGRRNPNFTDDFVSPRQRRGRTEAERNQTRGRSSVSPARSEIGAKSPNRRIPWSVENRRENDLSEQRRVSPIQSPRFAPRRNGPDPATTRSPRMKNPTAEIKRRVEKVLVPAEDEIESSVSGSSLISTNSQMDAERWRGEENRGGRNLLERCDKLLQSIAEMSTAAAATELQPSPVSVLDSAFCKEESSPSPVMKRSIDFKGVPFEWEDDAWSPPPAALESKSDDCDFLYICDVLRATNHLSDDSQLFLFLEKQQYLKGQDTSNISVLHRKLIFDTIHEILTRKRQVPPWKAAGGGQTCLQQVWSEFQQVKERGEEDSEDLVQVICGVLRKDLAGDSVTGWGDCPVEMSEAVLDMERLIFKDLIGETIRDLASVSIKCSGNSRVQVASRRKLVF